MRNQNVGIMYVKGIQPETSVLAATRQISFEEKDFVSLFNTKIIPGKTYTNKS